ncbi:putative 4-hydroxybenzoate polyprenyltransferase [Treponema sp.]
MKNVDKRLQEYGHLVMFSHSIFSFSFLVLAALIAADGFPGFRNSLLLVLAFLGARTAANAFNRIIDRNLDAKNPRTSARHLAAGSISVLEAILITLISSLALLVAAFLLSPLCVALLPVALLLILGYSYTKRFTYLCHALLGIACAAAPAGAYIALRGSLDLPSLVLCSANALWVMGFDIVYAIQDIDFDRKEGLHSIPARFGSQIALVLSALSHLGALAALLLYGILTPLGLSYFIGIFIIGILLASSSILAHKDYRRQVLFASYTSNQVVSLVLLASTVIDFVL